MPQAEGAQIEASGERRSSCRSFKVTGDGEVEVGDLLGPEEVICDLCNGDVSIRPVPMVGSYALCTACFTRQGFAFPGTISPYCVLPARDGEGVGR